MMRRNTQPEGPGEIMEGLLLLTVLHVLAGVMILFLIPFITAGLGYTFAAVWSIGFTGFCFWQLLYVVPLAMKLHQQGKTATMTGVIIGALLTALVNGACYLTSTR